MFFKILDNQIQNVDTYYNNGSVWLILTVEKKWVIELTKDGTLWYNFYFFKSMYELLALDVVENQHYITEWVEDIIQNGVINTAEFRLLIYTPVEDVIQNGIKETIDQWNQNRPSVKDVIEKGVKETTPSGYLGSIEMKGKIVHQFESPKQNNEVEDTIQNGIKETKHGIHFSEDTTENVIKNGIKETHADAYHYLPTVEGVITNNIKETNWRRVENFPEFEERVINNSSKLN